MDPLQHLDYGYSAPPPAYTEEEFDHKVSTAIEVSQQVSHDDEWEPYDPKAFEAAAEAYENNMHGQGSKGGGGSSTVPPFAASQTSGSSGSSVQPLRIHKKNPSSSTDSKADLKKQDYTSTKSMDESPYHEGSSSATPAGSSIAYSYNAGDGDDIAPPPFSELPTQAHQDPHTEFNPYQGFTPSAQQVPLPPVIDVGPSEEDPPQLSPLHDLQSSFGGPVPQALAAPEPLRQQAYRQSPQPFIQPPTAFEHRPRSAMASPVCGASFPNSPAAQLQAHAGGPTLRFSPSVAYNRKVTRQPFTMPKEEQKPQAFSAASFYNAAVSSHMTSRPSPYVHSPRPQQSALQQTPGSWGSPARPESVYSIASSFSGHTQSDTASQYGGYNGASTGSQAMAYDWRNNYQ